MNQITNVKTVDPEWKRLYRVGGAAALISVAGNIVCFEQPGEREVGYWLGKEYWGKGIATRALEEFLTYIDTRPLYAHVAKHNVASRRVLEKCGFTVSGEASYFSQALGKSVEEYILKLAANNQ